MPTIPRPLGEETRQLCRFSCLVHNMGYRIICQARYPVPVLGIFLAGEWGSVGSRSPNKRK